MNMKSSRLHEVRITIVHEKCSGSIYSIRSKPVGVHICRIKENQSSRPWQVALKC